MCNTVSYNASHYKTICNLQTNKAYLQLEKLCIDEKRKMVFYSNRTIVSTRVKKTKDFAVTFYVATDFYEKKFQFICSFILFGKNKQWLLNNIFPASGMFEQNLNNVHSSKHKNDSYIILSLVSFCAHKCYLFKVYLFSLFLDLYSLLLSILCPVISKSNRMIRIIRHSIISHVYWIYCCLNMPNLS